MNSMKDDIDDVFGGSKASGYIRLMLAKKKGMKVKDYAPEKKAREKKSKKYQVCKQDKFSANVLERFANKKLKENTSYPTEPEEWLYQRGPNFYKRGPDRKPEHKGNVIMPNEYHPDECKKDSTLEKKEQREAEKKAKKQEKEANKPTPEQKKAMKKEYDAQRYAKKKAAKANVEGKGKSMDRKGLCCKECKEDKTQSVCMSKKAYLDEHDRLIKMLADTSKKTGKEAKEQSAEVKKRQLKGGNKKLKLLELFKGTGSVGKVAKKLGFDVVSVDLDPIYTPEIETDILRWNYKKFFTDSKFIPDFIWASPPCNTYSPLAYPLKERDPKTAEPKSERAKIGTKILHRTLDIIDYVKSLNPNVKYTIENPRGMMRFDSKMKKLEINTTLYCLYGDDRMKPTNFWANFPLELKDEKSCPNKTIPVVDMKLADRYRIPSKLIRHIFDKYFESKKLKGGVLTEEKKKQLADERQAYVKDMKENPEKYKTKSFDPSEGGTKEPCSYRPALEKGGLTFKHRISAGYQTPEDCQRIQQAQIDESNRRLEENESGVNKFFRKVVGGLTKVADFATNLPFVPTVAKEAYKAFAPPGSEFYSGDGKRRKRKGGRMPTWAITMRKPQTKEQELELEKIRNPYYGQPKVECPAIPQVKARDGAVIFQGSKAKQVEEGACDAMIRGYESALKTKQWRDDNLGVSGFVSGLSKYAQPVFDVASFLPVVGSVARGISSGIDVAKNITDMAYAGNGITKIKVMKGAGMKPEEKTFFITAEQTYEDTPPKQVGDFLLIGNSPTIDAWLNYKTNTIMIAVRGTKDFRDVKADISLPFNNLINTQRYKTDKFIVGSLAKTFNPSVYDYYLTGHSLGGAIVAQLKRDFPFLKDAVLYNSAFQPKDLIQQSSNTIKRNYTSDDPLYQAGGKLFIGANVLPMSSSDVDGVLGRVIKGYKGHKISKFRELYAM